MDYRISLIVFFGSLIGLTSLVLARSYASSRRDSGKEYPAIDEWYTPNLRAWKQKLRRLWIYVEDLSLRKWGYLIVSFSKYLLYSLLRTIHKTLSGIIKFLEQKEDHLKKKMKESQKEDYKEKNTLSAILSNKQPPQK